MLVCIIHCLIWNCSSTNSYLFNLIVLLQDTNIELRKGNGSFKSEWKQMPMGTYNGKLVIGNDLHDVTEIEIDSNTETVYIVVEKGLTTLITFFTYFILDLKLVNCKTHICRQKLLILYFFTDISCFDLAVKQ